MRFALRANRNGGACARPLPGPSPTEGGFNIPRHLHAQREALFDPEAMLLVDDRQRQIAELHLVLDHGVGPDHQRGLSAGHQLQHLNALLFLLAARQPRHPLAAWRQQRFEPSDQLAEMLLRQDFGGCHQSALPAGVDRDGGAQGRDDGLARPDIALQQPVHRHGPAQIIRDLFADAALRGSEVERQGSEQLIVQGHGSPATGAGTPLRANRLQ